MTFRLLSTLVPILFLLNHVATSPVAENALNVNEGESLQTISQEVYNKIARADDTQLQSEAKALIAQYLVEAALLAESEDAGAERGDMNLPVAYGKHTHDYHHNWWHQQPAAAAAAIPAIPAAAPIVPEVARAPAVVAPAAPVPAPIQAPTPPQRVDTATQVPIITAPAPAAAPAPVPVAAPAPVAPVAAPVPVAAAAPPAPAAPVTPATTTTPYPTVDPVHALNQVNKILGNVANGNIVGIVDESLAIRAPPPVRNLVTNILKVVFCNPIDRLLRRCSQNQIDANRNSVKGR